MYTFHNCLASSIYIHPELSGCITTLTVRNMEVANFCAEMDTLVDQDALYHKHKQLVDQFSFWLNIFYV